MRTRSSTKRARSVSFDQGLLEQKQIVMPELSEVIELEDDSFASSLYHDLACDSAIDSFLKKSRFYSLSQRRWKLPRSYSKLLSNDFYTPIQNIISSVMKHFWRETTTHVSRQVVDTHATELQHEDEDFPTHSSRPSLVIKACGPSFQAPPIKTSGAPVGIGYSNIASCIDIQVEGKELPISEQLVKVAIYARQLFIHQPNRRFVRVFVLTGHHLRLFHFDRSGIQYTPQLDIHDDPHTFVRLVLGISSPNEADIGLDTSIQWTIANGRKASGNLTIRGADSTEVVYPLLSIDPSFSRSNIRGRCTTCWRVSDPATGEELLVKDSWRSDDRDSEDVCLQNALGIPGVVQMVSCEPNRGQTKDLRYFERHVPAHFQNRVETRIVMKCYGDPVTKFTSAKQLLCALRDAIAGHHKLLKKGTLHRDVSVQNILIGKAGAEPGHRGILIDLDLAIRYIANGSNPLVDWRIGTCLYQSVMVLASAERDYPLAHDHLDDLESFFYVLTQILYAYDCHGNFHSVADALELWKEYHGGDLAALKRGFLTPQSVPKAIASRWPKACLQLFYEFRDFIRHIVLEKTDVVYMKPEDGPDILQKLRLSSENHYSHVLGLFDVAITALDKAEAEEAAAGASPVPPPRQRNPLKRHSDEYPEAQPEAKRTNSPRIVRSPRSPTPRTGPRSA